MGNAIRNIVKPFMKRFLNGDSRDRAKGVLTGFRSPEDPQLTFVSGSGARVTDSEGREYIDLGAQSANLILGHFPKMADNLPGFGFITPKQGVSPAAQELARRLVNLAGPSYGGVHFTTSGALSIEAALKVARQVTGRNRFIAMRYGFHGLTAATQALASDGLLRSQMLPDLDRITTFAEPAWCRRCPWQLAPDRCATRCGSELAQIVRANPQAFAAVVAEPILASHAIVPPDDFWRPVREACDETGTLLIFDEIVSGLGRTGAWFAQQHYGVEADIIAISKNLNAGIVPLGAVIARQPIAERLRQDGPLLHGQADENHPLCCHVGLKVIDQLEDLNLADRARELGETMGRQLKRLVDRLPNVAEVRGKGMLWGVELDEKVVRPKTEEEWAPVRHRAVRERLLVTFWAQEILLTPPLTITDADLIEGLSRFERVLTDLT